MALSTRTPARVDHDRGQASYASCPLSYWQTVIAAGFLNAVDGSPATNPDSITDQTRPILTREPWMGNVLQTQVVYDRAGNISGGGIKCWGRNPDQNWTPCRNLGGAITRTMAGTVDDHDDGTYKYSVPDATLDYWDCSGFSEFVFTTDTAALSLTAGSAATAYLQARVTSLLAQV